MLKYKIYDIIILNYQYELLQHYQAVRCISSRTKLVKYKHKANINRRLNYTNYDFEVHTGWFIRAWVCTIEEMAIIQFTWIVPSTGLSPLADSPSRMNLTASVWPCYSLKTDVTSYECAVCISYTSALCSPSRLSLGAALMRRGFITPDTSVCKLICAAIWCPNSTLNRGEVWALQWTKKPVWLHLSVLASSMTASVSSSQIAQTHKQTNNRGWKKRK